MTRGVTGGYRDLQWVTRGYRFTGGYKGLQGVTRGYRGVTKGDWGGVTRAYSG